MSSTRASVRAAKRHLRGIAPSQIAAMKALDEDTLTALVTSVAAATAGESDEVREHAAIIAAKLYLGATGEGFARIEHATITARKFARRTVGLASLWESDTVTGIDNGMYDLAEMVDPSHSAIDHSDNSPADRIARITYGDLVTTALAAAGNASLDRAATDWMAHTREGCTECTGPGRRPTLTGISAHLEGWTSTDSRYWQSRRATLSGLAAAPTMSGLADRIGDPSPMAGRPTDGSATKGDRTPVTTCRPIGYGNVTVTARGGASEVRTLSEREQAAVASPRTVTAAKALALGLEAHEARGGENTGSTSGHAYGEMVGHAHPRKDGKPVLGGEDGPRKDGGMLRKRPRKRGGSGQTGSTNQVGAVGD